MKPRITDHIREEHEWFRHQFAALEAAKHDLPALKDLWATLSARLEVHAAAEEALFYPRLLEDVADADDDTEDAIRDHNEIRDGIRAAEEHETGDAGWWEGVRATGSANTEHITEEEEGPLPDFDGRASRDEQAELAEAFLAFEAEHPRGRGLSMEDKDPERYVADHRALDTPGTRG